MGKEEMDNRKYPSEKASETPSASAEPWLKKNIVVRIVTKSLGDKYYKKKGYVKELVDEFTAICVLNDTGAKLKLDQDHLETVVPQPGRDVLILQGRYSGCVATLRSIDTDNFCASVKLVTGDAKGEKIDLPYEHFSKLYS